MSASAVVAAIGIVDAQGIAGTSGVSCSWRALGESPPGTGRTFRAAFGRADETFRRLDAASRVLVLASEAAGITHLLPAAARDRAAIAIETSLGCLDADLQFARSLGDEMPDAPIFPYTLPSTCLGEVALRHGLRGPSVCLSVGPGDEGCAFAEATRMLAAGEAEVAVAGTIEALTRGVPGASAACAAVVAVLASERLGLTAAAPWPAARGNPFAALAAAMRR
jgi:3-oxoacyl-(acyl-carrier-protein) synthase